MKKSEGIKLSLRRINFLYRFIIVMGYVCFHSIYRLRVEGRENIPSEGPAVILPKHQFWTDIPIVGLAVSRPMNYIAKQELFIYPVVRHFLSSVGAVPIDRLNPVKTLDSFRYVEQLLQQGEAMVLFPEGTYYPNSMGRGKHRFIQSLLRIQGKRGWSGEKAIPFIPMGIQYRGNKFRPEVYVKIGRPLFAQGESEAMEFTRRITGDIAKLSGLGK
jgi:1-acyl-sn-glycerol-3-phosphate acyltransferase